MRAQLEAHAGDPDQPQRATLALTRALLSGFPRQRPVTLALLGFAPHPGLTPTPWALDGVLEACVEAERTPLRLLTLADGETGETLLRKTDRTLLGGADGRELVERPSRDRSISLRSRGQRRPYLIPRELVGTSLILCAPLLLRPSDQGPTRHWQGPLALALAELALAWGYAPVSVKPNARARDHAREAAAVGLELIAASFASAALILDATWAGVLEPSKPPPASARLRGPDGRFLRAVGQPASAPPRLLTELESPERCLAIPALDRLELDAALGVDQWLARALGLTRREGELPAPQLGGTSCGRWPQLHVAEPRSQPTRLADRAISGIRTQSRRLGSTLGLASAREHLALPARVPGRFAQQWTARWYGEHELRSPPRRVASLEPR
ncbi:MAG: hypothetical protein R6X02_32800 [Enhygromyxa sp.]